MSDDTTLNQAAGGDTVRTLDRTGTGKPKTEVVQLDTAGSSLNAESLVSAQNPLPVQSGFEQLRAALALQAAAYLAAQPQNGFTPLELPAFLTQLSNPATSTSTTYPATDAENAAKVTPVNFSIPSHASSGQIIVDRYGNNTSPGITDMSVALQNAVNVMLSVSGSSQLGCPVVFLGTAYSIVTPPTFGAYTASMLPIDIGGQGIATQIINNAVAGTAATFDMSARSGWRIHDLLICGNSVHKNDGIYAGYDNGNISTLTLTAAGSGYVSGTYVGVPLTGGSGTLAKATIVVSGGAVTSVTIVVPQGGINYLITDTGLSASNANLGGSGSGFTCSVASLTGLSNLWRIERVTSFAVGYGLKVRNTSSFNLDRFVCWPTGLDPTALKIPQTVTLSDVNHHIWLTGSFTILGLIVDCICLPRFTFAANSRGLKVDATSAYALSVIESDFESGEGTQTTGIDCANLTGCTFMGIWAENCLALFTNCAGNNLQLNNGGVGGGITLQTNSVSNLLTACTQTGAGGTLTFNDSSCVGNTVIGGAYNAVIDNATPPNTFIAAAAPQRGLNWGLNKLSRLSNPATITPDCTAGANFYYAIINVAATNVTVNAPINPKESSEITFCFSNQAGAPWTGTVTWNAIYKMQTWQNPANTLATTVTFFYNATDAVWTQKSSTAMIAGTAGLTLDSSGRAVIAAPSAGQALNVFGISGSHTLVVNSGAASGSAYGLNVIAGTTSGDTCAIFQNQTQTTNLLRINGDGNILARGISICLRATAIETRASTTTLTNSTQLAYAIPGPGTYALRLVVYFYATTAGTNGITANVNYSGTFTAVGSYINGYFTNGTTTTTGIQPTQISATVNNALAPFTIAATGSISSATPCMYVIEGELIATVTSLGTLAFAFAQNSSGTNTANLGVGSYMTVTQLS